MTQPTVLVTGASGFVGGALANKLQQSVEFAVRRAYRHTSLPSVDQVSIGDIGPYTDWSEALQNVDAVVHCAARVHIMQDAGSAESLARFREVNVEGSRRLAQQAAAAGVKRLVFVSSIKVNGEGTSGRGPYTHADTAMPEDAYGVSKHEAEQALSQVARDTGLEVVIVRPPLVYGPGVKANFRRLMQAVRWHLPLPFGAIENRRSMVYLQNLCDLLTVCIRHPKAAGRVFLVSDMQDVSTCELIAHMAKSMDVRPASFSIPPPLIWGTARLLNKKAFADRLLGSLQVDISNTCKILDWSPPMSLEQGLKETVNAFLQEGENQKRNM